MNKALKHTLIVTLFFSQNLFLNSGSKNSTIKKNVTDSINKSHKNREKTLCFSNINEDFKYKKKQTLSSNTKEKNTCQYILQKKVKKHKKILNLISQNYYNKNYFCIFNNEFKKIIDFTTLYRVLIE